MNNFKIKNIKTCENCLKLNECEIVDKKNTNKTCFYCSWFYSKKTPELLFEIKSREELKTIIEYVQNTYRYYRTHIYGESIKIIFKVIKEKGKVLLNEKLEIIEKPKENDFIVKI